MQFKGVKTKSAFSARVQRSFGLRMPSSSLHRSCDSLARSFFFRAVFFQPMRFFLPFSSPFLSVNFFFVVIVAVFFFSPLVLRSVTAACSFPFVWGLMAGLRCCAGHGGIISF